MKHAALFVLGSLALLAPAAAWAQVGPGLTGIAPGIGEGVTFAETEVGTTSDPRTITFTIEDFLSGDTSLDFALDVTASDPAFSVDDSGCASVTGGPSAGLECSVTVTFSPTAPGPATGDLLVSCVYEDVFSLGTLPGPSGAIASCTPDTNPQTVTFSAYLAGSASEPAPQRAIPVPSRSWTTIFALVAVLGLAGGITLRRPRT